MQNKKQQSPQLKGTNQKGTNLERNPSVDSSEVLQSLGNSQDDASTQDDASILDSDDINQNESRYKQTKNVQTEKVTKAWKIFNGNTELPMPENGTLSEGRALWRKTFNKFNGKTVTLENKNFNESEIECIETPTKNYYILFLGIKYEYVTNKATPPEDLYLQFEDMTKEHIVLVPVYSEPGTLLNPNAGEALEPKQKLVSKQKQKQKQKQQNLSRFEYVKEAAKKIFDIMGIKTAIKILKASSQGHSFLLIRKLGLGEKDPETSYLDSMKFENSVHRETVTPDLPEIKELISKAIKQKDTGRPQNPFNKSCVFYTYKFIFDMIKNDLYFDIDDKLAKFLDRNQFIDLDNGETDVGGPPSSLPGISTVSADDMIGNNLSGIPGYAKKVTSRLDRLANMITKIIAFQSFSKPSGPETPPISLSSKEKDHQKELKGVNQLTKEFGQLDLQQTSPSSSSNQKDNKTQLSNSSDQFLRDNSIALITTQQANLEQLRQYMFKAPEAKKLYDLLLTVDISDIVLVEKDFPDLKTFVNKNKLLEELKNTTLQDENTVFYIIIGYFFLKLKVKLLNSEKRENISEKEIQDSGAYIHAICKDPVPLKAKIINMSNIIMYFLTVPKSITTQSLSGNTPVSSTKNQDL